MEVFNGKVSRTVFWIVDELTPPKIEGRKKYMITRTKDTKTKL